MVFKVSPCALIIFNSFKEIAFENAKLIFSEAGFGRICKLIFPKFVTSATLETFDFASIQRFGSKSNLSGAKFKRSTKSCPENK